MITKKLMHDITTFCNNYINNNNLIISITKYPNEEKEDGFISLEIEVWKTGRYSSFIGGISGRIHSELEFNKYKEKILKELSILLKKL